MAPRSTPTTAAAFLAILLCGCDTLPPPAPALDAPVSDQYRHRPSIAALAAIDVDWWRGFGDPTLSALIEQALAANHDVRSALARVQAARASVAAQTSRLLPGVGLQAGASRSTSGLPAAVKQAGQPDVRALASALRADWEIDLAGGVRAARSAARADAAAAEAGVAAARLLVAGDVARLYFGLRGTEERLRAVQAMATVQRDVARVVERREAEGKASTFDLDTARAEADSVDAQIPPYRALLVSTEGRLAVLLGEDPSRFGVPSRPDYTWPATRAIGSGQPLDLLRRRPDLVAAEMRVAAESMRSVEARARTWPTLVVGALVGREDLRLGTMALGPVRFANLAAAFAMPVFDAGRIQAGIDAQGARESEALLAWQRAALTSIEDVEASLAARAAATQRGVSLQAARAARARSLDRARSLYREGRIDLLPLLDAQRSLLAAELSSSENALEGVLDEVRLFMALGGGWQPPRATPFLSPPGIDPSTRTAP